MAKTIVFFGAKGGLGKTLLAGNLAVALSRDQSKRTCLIDMDVQVAGDMARMLDLHPANAMVDLIDAMEKQPRNVKKEDFLFKSPTGISFLPAVLSPQEVAHLKLAKIQDVFGLLDKDFDFIVVDAGQAFNDVFVACLDQANLIVMVVVPDVLSIYQTKWAWICCRPCIFL